MTDNKNFPKIPVSQWWSLRKQFVKSIPAKVTPGYLAAILNMKEKSAQSNIMPSLVLLGIIDGDGNPLDRATKWRDDQEYSKVCEAMKKEVYPQELLDAFPGSAPNREAVERWFASYTGTGEANVKQLSSVFILLSEADPSKATITATDRKIKTNSTKSSTKVPRKSSTKIKPPLEKTSISSKSIMPSLHIDIQIHISSDATAEQIDNIFSSMAKHLY